MTPYLFHHHPRMAKAIGCLSILVLLLQSCNDSSTLFKSLSPSSTGIHFENNLEKKHAFGILYYLYYYNGGGVATGDINNDGLPDIYFTANSKGHNKLYLNKGDFKFEDITESAGVAGSSDWCTGASMADLNGDGKLDIYVSAVRINGKLEGKNELFINNGNNTFTESAAKCGLDFAGFTTQTAFFDYDHDGDLDCYVLNQSHYPNQNVVDTSKRRRIDPDAGDRLYRNDGIDSVSKLPHFTDVSALAGIYQSSLGYGLGISVADMNNDGWEDIYIGNDFHENDYYYINQQNGTFKDEARAHFGHFSRFSMGNDVGDYNNDGQPDIVTVDMLPPSEKLVKTYGSDESYEAYQFKIKRNGYVDQVSRNCLQRNNGDGQTFSDIGLMSGISATDWSWCPLFGDFDNDGKKDLFISSGIWKRPVDLDYVKFVSDLAAKVNRNTSDEFDEQTVDKMPDGKSHPFLFKGDGQYAFTDVSNEWGTGKLTGCSNGSAYADFDNDGRMDLVINCLNAPALVLRNQAKPSATANWASFNFRGEGMNKFGIGAKLWLFTANGIQYQQMMPVHGFQSSSDPRLHFGLGSLASIDSILVVWPDQTFEVIKGMAVNQHTPLEQSHAGGRFNYNDYFPPKAPLVNDLSSNLSIGWSHRENEFDEFNLQYLLPHKESTRGPKLAVADVNGDGLDDFYACGAMAQPGALFLQKPGGGFQQSDTAVFNAAAAGEEVDAVFFDADGNGTKDLYIVAGGTEPIAISSLREDRLYINDGKGHFTKAINALPQIYDTKSCVTVADIDKDGDSDLFIGTLTGKTYGQPLASRLLINDGKAHFSLSPQSSLFNELGMVTTASFADLNRDGWADLIVSGEFMPVKIFMNQKGSFSAADIPNSTGLWQTIKTSDVNGDGLPDLLAGNWGRNSKLWAGKNGPVKMYVKDFDMNGSVEQILCYTVDGKQYTFLAKDELEKALPVLKKAYLRYDEVAGKDVQYMFYDLFKDYREFTAETLSSTCFLNDGKGGFKQITLPDALQVAPIFSFAEAGPIAGGWIAAGNFYGVMPYEGRYDALEPTLFSFNSNTNQFATQLLSPALRGEMRDAKWLGTKTGKLLLLARNNDSIIFCEPKK
jgi:hypothetical protein